MQQVTGRFQEALFFICGAFSWFNPLESLLDISDLSILMVSIWIKWFDAKPECIKLFKLDQFMVQSPNALYALFPYRSQFVSDRHWCLFVFNAVFNAFSDKIRLSASLPPHPILARRIFYASLVQ